MAPKILGPTLGHRIHCHLQTWKAMPIAKYFKSDIFKFLYWEQLQVHAFMDRIFFQSKTKK